MKIFALHLSLEFVTKAESLNYGYELMSMEELRDQLSQGIAFSNQQFYVEAEDTDACIAQVFKIQKSKTWRAWDLSISFVFKRKEERGSFLNKFKSLFKAIDAAGGLVVNEREEYLMIYNRNKWTLPKGHVEKGESIDTAAVREVKEETGIQDVSLAERMPDTFHTFKKKKKWILKTTYWYKMYASSQQELQPEVEEDIEDVQWMSKEDWLKVAEQSYPLTRDLFVSEFTKSLI